jgi:hypothetical protein
MAKVSETSDWKDAGLIPLHDLIQRIRHDLQHDQTENDFPVFYIDEVNVEINFVVTGDIKSGFNLGVASLGSKVSESRTQKIGLKLSPLMSKEEAIRLLEIKTAINKILDEQTNQPGQSRKSTFKKVAWRSPRVICVAEGYPEKFHLPFCEHYRTAA